MDKYRRGKIFFPSFYESIFALLCLTCVFLDELGKLSYRKNSIEIQPQNPFYLTSFYLYHTWI
jgi:hypothetical protein